MRRKIIAYTPFHFSRTLPFNLKKNQSKSNKIGVQDLLSDMIQINRQTDTDDEDY